MKFEYGDFYKFLVSLGVALIGLSLVVPWLFLREPFDLLLTTTDLAELTPLAEDVIAQRQIQVSIILRMLPWLIGAAFLLGAAMLIVGGIMWFRRSQRYADEQQRYETELARRQLEDAPPERIQEAHMEEALEAGALEAATRDPEHAVGGGGPGPTGETYSRLITPIEQKLVAALRQCAPDCEVLPQMQLDDMYFDIVVLSSHAVGTPPDNLIDVRYIPARPSIDWIESRALRQAYQTEVYRRKTGRNALARLVLVAPPEVIAGVDRWGQVPGLPNAIEVLGHLTDVHYLADQELDHLDCDRIRTILAVG